MASNGSDGEKTVTSVPSTTAGVPTRVATLPHVPPGVPAASHLAVLVNRFALEALIGRGGMGTVYRAYDLVLEEGIALKTVEGPITDHEFDLLRREVKLARRVTHPNVVRTFDLGIHERTPFLTMELVEGESLHALLRREGVLPRSRIQSIALAIASGLAAAHEASILHLDLKPGNVLFGKDGRVAVSDFGLASSFADAPARSIIAGTPRYMAPEVMYGEAPSARADVYSFGVLLYEMHLGRKPTPEELLRVAPEVMPQDHVFLVSRCLAANPALRFATATEVLDELRRAVPPNEPSAPRAAAVASTTPTRAQARSSGAAPALEHYLLGRVAYNQLPRLREAVAHFDAARELAPNDARIVSACALARIRLQIASGEELVDAARELALRARSLDPELAEGDLAVAAVEVQLAREAEAMAPLASALRRAPWLPDAHALLGQVLTEIGEVERGREELSTALALDPLMVMTTMMTAHLRALLGDVDGAEALLQFDATASENYGPFAWRRLRALLYDPRPERIARLRADLAGRDFALQFMVDAAWAIVERRVLPDVLEIAFATMGAPSSAPRRTTAWSTIIVDALAYAGRHDEAIAQLDVADRHGLLDLTWLDRSPPLSALRQHPQFRTVRENVRARAAAVREAAHAAGLLTPPHR